MDASSLALFVAAGLLLNLTPGVDMALVASRAAAHGWRSGAAAALGVGAGCLLHALAAALGLSALLAASAGAFALLRWLGAAYLVWVGIGLLRTRPAAAAPATAPAAPRPWRSDFLQGLLTNALNPKVVLFFVAFLPQFVAPGTPHHSAWLLGLGLLFNLNGTLVNLAIAALVARLRRRGSGLRQAGAWFSRLTGAAFVVLGLKLAWDAR